MDQQQRPAFPVDLVVKVGVVHGEAGHCLSSFTEDSFRIHQMYGTSR